ncbi:lysM and putative peptidoglycan-binding domain-containing protein 2 [Danaus plexippus plexippus]|uniref:LysM and putative peptidoglycan-binding domain-containing protein 2 n=2 Tax=Danaus plexippus TaxID=13037 RepID=A0A212FLH8_DANPL|nr:lysM and putative peptidoglycan-binding domain-containing protein 2 isoform X2 [Danaus plexippus plexippus]OWR54591.1 lysM and putative peptidoglycan-binding domain-containing protein 2 [Danaus plexippus plexippus]
MEEDRLFDERVSIRESARPLKKYGSTCNHIKRNEEYIKHVMSKGDTLQGIALKYGVTMEKIRRVNRLFATDSLFLREYLLIPVTKESPYYENGERVTEIALPSHRASIAGMPTRDFSPGSPDEKESFDNFLNRLDSSIANIKKHVEKSKETSEFVKDLDDGYVRHRPTARLRQSASMGASTSYNEVIPPPLPPPLTQGRRVDNSLRRLERAHDDLFQL